MSEPLPPISDSFLQAESEIPVHFVREHLRHIFSLIYQLVNDEEVAQELTQDTFIRALQRQPSSRQLTRIGRRLPALAASAALEYLRRNQTQQPKSKRNTHIRQEQRVASSQEKDALSVLTTSERVALLLHDTEHIPLSAVARRMDCPEATARIHLARARVKIAQFLRAKKAV